VATHIEPACEAALLELARRGYSVRRVYGYAAIDQARNAGKDKERYETFYFNVE
jgi:hypothetical protein